MDAATIQSGVNDLTSKIASSDRVDFESAINQYFDANATLETPQIRVRGATRIKQWSLAQNYPAKFTALSKKPTYNERDQIIDFTYERTYLTPKFPSWVPLYSVISGFGTTLHFDTRFHLNSGDSTGRSLLVTKAVVKRRELVPGEGLVPWSFFRPLLSLLVLSLFIFVGFLDRHSFHKEGIVGMAQSAYTEAYEAIWNTFVAEKEKRTIQGQQYRDDKEGQLRSLLSTALTTAQELEANLENRAKAAGIPVEQYKQQVRDTASVIQKNAEVLSDYVQGKAKEASISATEQVQAAERQVQEEATGTRKRVNKFAEDVGSVAEDAGSSVQEGMKGVGQAAGEVAGNVERQVDGVAEVGKEMGDDWVNGVPAAADNGEDYRQVPGIDPTASTLMDVRDPTVLAPPTQD